MTDLKKRVDTKRLRTSIGVVGMKIDGRVVIELLDRLERYRETLQFYADKENWTTGTSKTFSAIRCSNFPMGDTDSDFDKARDGYVGGRRAREALEGEK